MEIWGFIGERAAHKGWKKMKESFEVRGETVYHDSKIVGTVIEEGIEWHDADKGALFEELLSDLPVEHHGMNEEIKPDWSVVIEYLSNFSYVRGVLEQSDEPILLGMLPPPFAGAPDVPIEVKGGTVLEMRRELLAKCPDAFIFNDNLDS